MSIRKYFGGVVNYLFPARTQERIEEVQPQISYERTGRWETTVTATWLDGRTEQEILHLGPTKMIDRAQEAQSREWKNRKYQRSLLDRVLDIFGT